MNLLGHDAKGKRSENIQGCRSGPESGRQTLVSPIFRSPLTICGGMFPKMHRGQICNLDILPFMVVKKMVMHPMVQIQANMELIRASGEDELHTKHVTNISRTPQSLQPPPKKNTLI